MQTFPGQLLESNYTDPENPDRLVGRSEVERPEQHFQLLDRHIIDGQYHPCVQLAKDCLHNSPSRRPTAEQLVATLEGMRADIEGSCGAVVRADAVRQVRIVLFQWSRGCFLLPPSPGNWLHFMLSITLSLKYWH